VIKLFVNTGAMAEMNNYRNRMPCERLSAKYQQKATQQCTNYLSQQKTADCSTAYSTLYSTSRK